MPLAFFTGGEVHVFAFGGGEDGLHPVIIGLQDGIELVVVTLGAADGHTEEYRPDGAGHFAQHFLPVCFFVLIAANQMDRAGAMEAGCDQRIVASRVEFIAGDLFLNEQAVGLVPIEAADHIVSVAPGVRAFQVEFVAVGIGIADDIEPALRPALAVVLGLEQAIDHLRIGIGRMVGEEQVDFSGSGRQTDEVQRDSAQQALFARQGGRFQILRVEGVQQKRIDRCSDPGVFDRRNRMADGLLKRPPVAAVADECLFLWVYAWIWPRTCGGGKYNRGDDGGTGAAHELGCLVYSSHNTEAFSNTSSSMRSVSFPVDVFCWLG